MITVFFKVFPIDIIFTIYKFKKNIEEEEATNKIINAYMNKNKRKITIINNFIEWNYYYKNNGYYPFEVMPDFMNTVVSMKIISKYDDFDWWVNICHKLHTTVRIYENLSDDDKYTYFLNVKEKDIQLIKKVVNDLIEKFTYHYFG